MTIQSAADRKTSLENAMVTINNVNATTDQKVTALILALQGLGLI